MERMMIRGITLLVIIFQFSGCATYTGKECSSFNWMEQGYLAALNGNTLAEGLLHFHDSCGKDYGIMPDQKEFEQGFQKGLQLFCSADNAYLFGSKGGTYKGTCPEKKEAQFVAEYALGHNNFLEKQIEVLKRQNDDLKEKIDDLESTIGDLERKISNMESELAYLKLQN